MRDGSLIYTLSPDSPPKLHSLLLHEELDMKVIDPNYDLYSTYGPQTALHSSSVPLFVAENSTCQELTTNLDC